MRIVTNFFRLFLLIALWGQGANASSGEGPWFETDFAKMRLISSSTTAGLSGELHLGLEVALEDGWKTYWRTPGDAGLPPQIFLDPVLLAGASSDMSHPLPKRFTLFDLETFGYSERVIFPITLRLSDVRQATTIEMMAEILVCSDICIPVQGPLKLGLLLGDIAPSQHHQAIAQARSHVPKKRAGQISLSVADKDNDPALAGHLIAELSQPQEVRDILIEGVYAASFGAPQKLSDTRYLIPHIGGKGKAKAGDQITVTLDGTQAFESQVKIGARAGSKEASEATLPIWLIALLGGFILNFMPCVLPVLSLKLSSVIAMGGASARQIRLRFIASAAGIMASFLLLAAGLHSLRAVGGQVGWGIQFQSPVFLGFLLIVTTLFTLSLFGVVHIRIPSFVTALSMRGTAKGYQGDFASGMLATLLATPCSAPFVGTAVSFAFSQSTLQLYAVMMMMGLGLALPWLSVAALPRLIAFLPKPGAWMGHLQKGLGVLMALTVLWVASLFLGAAGLRETRQVNESSWLRYDPTLLAELRSTDQLVFVDVTADWCLTCKANKALVLETDQAAQLLSDYDVVLIQADWTKADLAISDYLASNDRFGIPFNILYGRGEKDGVILPEIFTFADLQNAVLQANRSQP